RHRSVPVSGGAIPVVARTRTAVGFNPSVSVRSPTVSSGGAPRQLVDVDPAGPTPTSRSGVSRVPAHDVNRHHGELHCHRSSHEESARWCRVTKFLRNLLVRASAGKRAQRLLEWNVFVCHYLMGIGSGSSPQS